MEIIVHKNLPLPVIGYKIIWVNANNQKNEIEFSLVQFLDQSDNVQELRTIVLKDLQRNANSSMIEIIVENKVNGVLGLKIKDKRTDQNIKFEFLQKRQLHKYDFDKQYKLINSYQINNIF